MQCSVVIPCCGGAELTAACVDSLLAQTGGHELEILLVDNGNDPATAALAGGCIRVLAQDRNLGFGGGTNVGVRAAQYDCVLLLNNDTQAAPHMLSRLHAALQTDDRIGLCAPVSNHVKGEAQLPVGDRGASAAGRDEIEAELAAEFAGVLQDVDTLSGLCLLAARATLLCLGLFDERFGAGNYEDDDLCFRARLRGHRLVIARDAFVHHEGHCTFRALGLDFAAELQQRAAQFRAKWCDDPAGAAMLKARDGNLEGAAAAATLARRTNPLWPDADWYLGRLHVESHRPADAVPHLQSFLRQCPHHPEAVILLGMCWLELGQPAPAQRLWRWARTACHFAPAQAADLLRRLGEYARSKGDLAEAAANFAAAVDLRPEDPFLLNWLGVALLELRRFPEAIAVLERAAAAGYALAHTNLGICHFQTGDPQRALRHFSEAARLLPADPTAQQNFAQAQSVMSSGS